MSFFDPGVRFNKPTDLQERTLDVIIKDHLDTCPGHSDVDNKDAGYIERTRFLMTALAGEAGEALNLIKKEWRGDEDISDDYESWEVKVESEVVDCANYVSMLAAHLDLPIGAAQRGKFLAVESRPSWAGLLKRQSIEKPEIPHDSIHLEYNGPGTSSVPLAPLGSITSRVQESIVQHLPNLTRSFRTSKETIGQLLHIGGVIDEAAGCRFFLGRRIRAWGDYT